VTERPWRLFVAVPIEERLRAGLADAIAGWRDRPDCADLRWTDADAWHLTTAFLGATDPARLEEIRAAVARAAGTTQPFTLGTGGVGAFPSRGRANVAWYGIDDAEGRLAGLAAAVRRELGLDPETRPFRPHLTLARARGAGSVDLRRWVADAAATAPSGTLRIDELHLMRSHLGGGPARYETVGRAPLGAPAVLVRSRPGA
jgi:2'-5' RNA ligase